ncbi:MAG: hypothetical protein ACJAYX_003601 [Planctomycetota bacterium]|jgi:hypothetical protein
METTPETQCSPEQPARPTSLVPFLTVIAVQVLAVVVIVFGDIGFDRPGRFGLDFGHGLLLVVLWFGASCAGFWLSLRVARPWALWLQGLVFVLVVCGGVRAVCWPSSSDPVQPDAIEGPRGG